MKIQRPNTININNPYQRHVQNYQKQKTKSFNDELNISKEAIQLQETNQITKERTERVDQLKQLVDSGEYKVNHEQVVQKMLDFWGNRT